MLDEKERCSIADSSRELRRMTCQTCGCDCGLAVITRFIQMGDGPIWLEFAGECGHRWSVAAELAKGSVNILPFDLTDHLWESYRILTKQGERTASSISIELFFGDVVLRLIAGRQVPIDIPIDEGALRYIRDRCTRFLADRVAPDPRQMDLSSDEPKEEW